MTTMQSENHFIKYLGSLRLIAENKINKLTKQNIHDEYQLRALGQLLEIWEKPPSDNESPGTNEKKSVTKKNVAGNHAIQNKEFLLHSYSKDEINKFSGKIFIGETLIEVWLEEALIEAGVEIRMANIGDESWKKISSTLEGKNDLSNDQIFLASSGLIDTYLNIFIPENLDIHKPFCIQFNSQAQTSFSPLLINIEMDKNAQAKIAYLLESEQNGRQEIINIPLILLVELNESAKLDFIEVQNLSLSTRDHIYEIVRVRKNALINALNLDLGSVKSKRYYSVDLMEDGAEAVITGVYVPKNNQKFHMQTYQNHNASNTKSDLAFKGVLEGRSESYWKGNIFVGSEIFGVDSYQSNQNLCLSADAKVQSIPGLEILSDDVKCSHGVTISAVDMDQVFYMQSRGINTEDAINLIKDGFISAAISRVNDDGLKEILGKWLEINNKPEIMLK